MHADPCKGFTYVGMAKRALQVRNVYATAADSMPSRICTARCSPVISLSDEHAALRDAASTVHALAPLCRPRRGLFRSCRGGSKERISSAGFLRGLHFSCANGALLYEVHLHVGPHRQVPYWKNGVLGSLNSSNFSGLAGAAPQGRRGQGASRPARGQFSLWYIKLQPIFG